MAYQRRPPTLLLLISLCSSPWPTSARIYWSHLGVLCVEDCQRKSLSSIHQCKVRMADGTEELHYCSPNMGKDYLGYVCEGLCATHSYSYYWCNTDRWGSWGYCGEVTVYTKHYTSNYDVQCYDGCEKRGYDYYWCHTQKGYDYCSARNNFDYKGNKCIKNYPCNKYDRDYYWCYLEKGGWDYCAPVEPKATRYQTYNLEECIDDCRYHEHGDYFWCHTQYSWDYCSPLSDLTYKGEPCRPNHECGTYGYSYSWCYTTSSNHWDYCGMVSYQECRKQHSNTSREYCTWEENAWKVVFSVKTDHKAIAEPNKKLRKEALQLIDRWNNQGLGNQSRSNLLMSGDLRIDLQEVFTRDDQQYYKLQIQVNSQGTILSQIKVPVETSAETMREAFKMSLNQRAKTEVQKQKYTYPTSQTSQQFGHTNSQMYVFFSLSLSLFLCV
ncbi:uncharacterized protein LOC143112305 [Alosa pseudoharengus]|uniref:uncharacterized protein LOC143112305 n=1 Tax=Alosa pseudoharengus TaxID=34774 RepID=UPI003F8CE9A2